jgi:predicted dehydrogenase
LDGGVHFTAALRLLLGPSNPLISLSANTTQLQKHLPPVDTVDATLKTKDGATGTFSVSFGTSFKGSEWAVACEKGIVSVSRSDVTIGEEMKKVEDERSGVPPEVRKWGEALAKGMQNERQIPEEALADLELLEKMLKSGEAGGSAQQLTLQTW